MPTRERWGGRILGTGLAVGLAAAFALALWHAAGPPSGPVELPWDRVACAHCRMLVSDPRYAGQLHTTSGEVLFFDDPGCLLLHQAEHEAAFAAAYFHDSRGAGWLSERQVAFVRVNETPMAYGFAAVAREAEPRGLSPDEARTALVAGAGAPRSVPR